MTLEREDFLAWLTSQPEGSIVGRSRSRHECPIVNCLETTKRDFRGRVMCFYAAAGTYGVYGSRQPGWPMPPWMGAFVRRIDTQDRHNVAREEALAALHGGATS